jgi:hypothetical protein
MTEQTAQRPSPDGSALVHELNQPVNKEVAAAISVVPLAAASNDKLSATHRHAELDARDCEHFNSNIDLSGESVGQRKAGKIPPRTRVRRKCRARW